MQDGKAGQGEESVSVALSATSASLLDGVRRMGVGVALPAIEDWERRLVSLGDPELAPIAQAMTELKTQLSVDGSDPATVGALLMTLGVQVSAVADSELGVPVAEELERLSALLTSQGEKLAEYGR
jgi:hypothetical protein